MKLTTALAIAGVTFSLNATMVSEPVAPVTTTQTEIVETNSYSDEDLYWLSHLIYAEVGSDTLSDELQRAVGSVILNRRESDLYPDTIKKVIFDKHWGTQYGCTTNGMIYKTPNDRAIENAKYLLENGSTLPSNVLGQSNRTLLNGRYCVIQGVVFSYY